MALFAAAVFGAIVFTLAGFCFGAQSVSKTELRKGLRDAGLTKDSAKLLGRAAKILRRLEGLTDLDGDLSPDLLSATSRKLVTEWVADYRKGFDPK